MNEAGVSQDDISVLMSEQTRGREFVLKAATKAPEGAATGLVAGGALGAIAAALVAVGSVAIPGIGLFAAGPLVAALAGAGAGGVAGGLVGSLVGLGFPEHEAKLVSDQVQKGAILVGVEAHEDRVDAIKKIMKDAGGKDVRS